MKGSVSNFVISPLLFIQAIMTRARALKLPEPPGPRSGVAGEGQELRLLITGDSAAAGVGAEHQQEALSGQLVARLRQRFRVIWSLEAETGATTASTLERLSTLAPQKFDVAVTSLGVNDVTRHTGAQQWRDLQRQLRVMLREQFGVSLSLISGLPPMHGFPALPQPLRQYLGGRATKFDDSLKADLMHSQDSCYLGLRFADDPALMARDGFHPGPDLYAEWGRRAGGMILDRYAGPA